MALSLKLLICLLLIACAEVKSQSTALPPPATTEKNEVTTAGPTEAPATGATEGPATGATEAPATGATEAPATGPTEAPATGPTEAPATGPTEAPDPCHSKPCSDGSTCFGRAQETYVCLCKDGDNYNYAQQKCISAKVFPGNFVPKGITFKPQMDNPASVEFQTAAAEIVKTLKGIYEKSPNKKYLNSTVISLSAKSKANLVVAKVNIEFAIDSPVTPNDVMKDIETAGAFDVTSYCPSKPCDVVSTLCTEEKANPKFKCTCKDKYVPTNFTDRLCVACPNGMKPDEGACVKCNFGYTGSNCEENWQLILVAVGSVFGALLLISIIVSSVVITNSKKKLKKAKATDYEKPHSNPAPTKTPQLSNGLAAPRPTPLKPAPAGSGFGGNGVPRIPRATTNDNWDRNTNLEMVPSNSRQNLIPTGRNSRRFDDQEDTNPYSRPSKPQNNPYAMGRPQTNPYASNQGHNNPYYRR